MWRDFPQKLCDATRCRGIVYDRTGYGGSSRWPGRSRRALHGDRGRRGPAAPAGHARRRGLRAGRPQRRRHDRPQLRRLRSRAAARRGDAGRARHQRTDLRRCHPAGPRGLRRGRSAPAPAEISRRQYRRRLPSLVGRLGGAGLRADGCRWPPARRRRAGAGDPGRGRRIRQRAAARHHRRQGRRLLRDAAGARLRPQPASAAARLRPVRDHPLRGAAGAGG